MMKKHKKSKKRKRRKPVRAFVIRINLLKWDIIPYKVIGENFTRAGFLCFTINIYRWRQ